MPRSDPGRDDFTRALNNLFDAAGRPESSVIVRRAQGFEPRITVTASLLTEWRQGSIPRDENVVTFLVTCLSTLAGRTVTAAELRRWRDLRAGCERVRRRERATRGPAAPAPTLTPDPVEGATVREAYRRQVSALGPTDGLRGRDSELEMLAGFCAGDGGYLHVQGPPWAGKTALLATFALRPPPGVVVVAFFVTRRIAGHTDCVAFTEALLEQLSAVLGRATPHCLPAAHDAHRRQLLDEAARKVHRDGGRLVLIVDGLDEDTGAEPGSPLPSIASLLPASFSYGLKVIVSGRPARSLPADVRDDHPLRFCPQWTLTPSPHAQELAAAARHEMTGLLVNAGSIAGTLVGFVAASGGGLACADLEQLTGEPPYLVGSLLDGVLRRSIRATVVGGDEDNLVPGYVFVHETLRAQATEALGARRLGDLAERIHRWADTYRMSGWPASTPTYLLTAYQHMVDDTGQLTALATDRARHESMFRLTGGDATALAEIETAVRRITPATDSDIESLVRLARQRRRLQEYNGALTPTNHGGSGLPPDLPVLWATIGRTYRAERMAQSIPFPEQRAKVLRRIAAVTADRNPARAEAVARGIDDPEQRTCALVEVATTAAGDPDYASRLVQAAMETLWRVDPGIASSYLRPRITAVLAATDPERVARIAGDRTNFLRPEDSVATARLLARDHPTLATRVAEGFDRAHVRASALAAAAGEMAAADPAAARRLLGETARIARELDPGDDRDRCLSAVATAQGRLDPDNALRTLELIAGSRCRLVTEAAVATAISDVDPGRALELARSAVERAFADGGSPFEIRDVAEALADCDPDWVETQSRHVSTAYHAVLFATAASKLAVRISDRDPERCRRLAREAHAIVDMQVGGVSEWEWEPIGRALALADPDSTEDFVRRHSGTDGNIYAVLGAASGLARTDVVRAARLAGSVNGGHRQARVLAAVGLVAARHDPAGAGVVAAEAEARVRETPSGSDAAALSAICAALLPVTPEQAVALASRCESHLDRFEHSGVRNDLRETLAGIIARVDADRADSIAQGIDIPSLRMRALLGIARTLTAADPARVGAFVEAAEQLVRAEQPIGYHDMTMLVEVLATHSADRAERFVSTVDDHDDRAYALATLAKVLAATDPARARGPADAAEEIGRSNRNPFWQSLILELVAKAVVGVDPERAVRLATGLLDEERRALTVAAMSAAVATTNPAGAAALNRLAEDAARSIPPACSEGFLHTREFEQASALVAVADAAAGPDPVRAGDLLVGAADIAEGVHDPDQRARILFGGAKVAARLPTGRDLATRLLAAGLATTSDWSACIGAVAELSPSLLAGIADEILPERVS